MHSHVWNNDTKYRNVTCTYSFVKKLHHLILYNFSFKGYLWNMDLVLDRVVLLQVRVKEIMVWMYQAFYNDSQRSTTTQASQAKEDDQIGKQECVLLCL